MSVISAGRSRTLPGSPSVSPSSRAPATGRDPVPPWVWQSTETVPSSTVAPTGGEVPWTIGLWDDRFAEAIGPRLARLRHLARQILRSEDLADDAVQEALLSLWTRRQL